MSLDRAKAWIEQAENDLLWGKDSLRGQHFAQVCFIAQQIGEKSIKAIAFLRGADLVKSHSIVAIAEELKLNGKIKKIGQILDGYYISTRYPDAYPDFMAPHKFFDSTQAQQAIKQAEAILQIANLELRKRERNS